MQFDNSKAEVSAADFELFCKKMNSLSEEQNAKLKESWKGFNKNQNQADATFIREMTGNLKLPSMVHINISQPPHMHSNLGMQQTNFLNQPYYPQQRPPIPPSYLTSISSDSTKPSVSMEHYPPFYNQPPIYGSLQPIRGIYPALNPVSNPVSVPASISVSRPTEIHSFSTNPSTSRHESDESNKGIIIADELEHLWSGFITRNKQNRVGVDAYLISGDLAEFFTAYNLNITHRTSLEEVKKIDQAIFGVVVFTIQNETQATAFASYIEYFNKKQGIGIIPIKSNVLIYLIPPCDFAKKYINTKESFMLGILVNTDKLPKIGNEDKKLSVAALPLENDAVPKPDDSFELRKKLLTLISNPKMFDILNDPSFENLINQKINS